MQISKGSQFNGSISNTFLAMVFALLAVVTLLVVRGALFYFESWDYIQFLSIWVSEFRSMTFFEALGANVGNYNPAYMYILNIISRIGIPDLYLIKAVSVIFDFVIAYFIMKLVSLKSDSSYVKITAFILALAIPTVILNSSMWAQCDSIYTAFALGSIYFALSQRSKMAYAFIALALSFKLQAAFVLPIFAVFLLKEKIRLKDCYIFFVVYIAMLLPAIVAGRSIADLLLIYFTQTDTYHHLNLNSVNIWQLVGDVEFRNFRIVGLFISGLAALALMFFTYICKERLVKTVDYIRLAYLFAVILPFLLPQMHDRFFYMADVLSLAVFLFDRRKWYVPIVTIFCSYIAYAWYLMGWAVIIDFKIAALALLTVIILVLRDYVISLSKT